MNMNTRENTGFIHWFTHNPVAANLLMGVIIFTGLLSFLTIKRSLNPDIEQKNIHITVPYLGAAPEEVERSVTMKIEERIKDIEGIDRYFSVSSKALSTITVEVDEGYNLSEVLDQIQSKVDSIKSFPKEIEKPIVAREHVRHRALMMQIYGDMDERSMKTLAQKIKLEMLQNPIFSAIEIHGTRDYEIGIEVSEEALRKHQLNISDVVHAINTASVDIPGGSIKTDQGNILLRTNGQAYNQYDFEKIVLKNYPDSSRLFLGDIATIIDGFAEVDGFARFNGKLSVALSVFAAEDQNIIEVARAAQEYVAEKSKTLPDNVSLTTWGDATYYLESRLNMMTGNLLMGALLVFLVLALFLDLKSAFWVIVGIPVCFLGAFILMPLTPFNVSLNMVSLFGFLLVLGIVVDDAIIIAEAVHTQTYDYGNTLDNVVTGAKSVALPATFGVLTTIAAFAPTIFVEGSYAALPQAIGYVVIFCLSFSLIESKWILPAHLGQHSRKNNTTGIVDDHDKPANAVVRTIQSMQDKCDHALVAFAENHYRPFIKKVLRLRYLTVAFFIAGFAVTIGLITSGIAPTTLIPDIPSDFLIAKVEMREGSSDKQIRDAMATMENAIIDLEKDYLADDEDNSALVDHRLVMSDDGHIGIIMLELVKSEKRTLESRDIIKLWRERVGDIAGTKLISYSSIEDAGGPPLSFKILGSDTEQLVDAANDLERKLNEYDGVFDIANGSSDINDELYISIKPVALSLGLSLSDIGRQVRQSFYGAEAQRVQRGNDEVKVMVRFPKEQRQSLASLENMFISTPTGEAVPFSAVASVEMKRSLAKNTRVNGEKAITVAARVDKGETQPGRISDDVMENFAHDLEAKYPNIKLKLDGEAIETQKLIVKLFISMALAIMAIYVLLAIPLKSYTQPLMIMSVIPFGIIGAVIGHMVMGASINMLSFFGIIALSGVVVNDSLVLVDFINRAKEQGLRVQQAIVEAGIQRFRAVLVTSLTTFFGLVPMLFETSLQAQLVVPMAISLSFGIAFATLITLILVPCLYNILLDFEQYRNARKGYSSIHQPDTALTD